MPTSIAIFSIGKLVVTNCSWASSIRLRLMCYLPNTLTKKWSWGTFWMAQALFAWIIMPLLIVWLTVPDFFTKPGGGIVLIGMILSLFGVVICGWSGFIKEKDLDASYVDAHLLQLHCRRVDERVEKR